MTWIPHLLFFYLFVLACLSKAGETYQTLDKSEWIFLNRSTIPGLTVFTGKVTIPGDIYQDLRNANLIEDPLYADNDIKLRWVARENWTYSSTFDVEPSVFKQRHHLLVFDGIDTIASVILNGKEIMKTNNQFVQYTADVSGSLSQTRNKLEIDFESPISYVDRKAIEYKQTYNYSVPPECTIEMFHGECHANFIRKIQAQFSWDWGPAFPTIGIFEPIRLIGNDGLYIERVYIDTIFTDDGSITIKVHADIKSALGGNIHWDVTIPELNKLHNILTTVKGGLEVETNTAEFELKKSQVELWWPNGMGSQKMYDMNVQLTREDKKATTSKTVRFGLRKVELIQDLIDVNNASIGRDFYFKINDQPVFLKGSNWIPVSPFPSRNNSERMEFLLESSKVVGMNAMRVWGGGRYETDEFYEMADTKGIMLWHDMMFACSLYPTDPAFLDSVKTEIAQQVKRLKNHPSVLVWAGNNENELGISGGWWAQPNKEDYLKLYKEVIAPIVNNLDPTRPYLLSSPSNGIETEAEGGISSNPSNPRYGDIHFYNEAKNLWRDESYQTPRCTTEYGLQSLPSGQTMSRYLPQSDYHYLSGNYTHRQHHPGGIESLIYMIFSHFPLPQSCSNLNQDGRIDSKDLEECTKNSDFIDRHAYFTQFHQALTYKTETEHYIRYRNLLTEDGLGHTMCALYWQLNDVWAAPTWSSIDWDLRWKPAHYEARRFFSPNFVVIFFNEQNDIEAYAINDRLENLKGVTVKIRVYAFDNNFEAIYEEHIQMDLEPYSSSPVHLGKINNWKNSKNDLFLENLVFTADLIDVANKSLGFQSTIIPDKLYKINLGSTGDVTISSFKKISDLKYSLDIEASGIAPLVWIEVMVDDLLAYFDDNAFTMTQSTRTLILTLTKPFTRDLQLSDLYACSLKNCYT